MFKMFSDRPCLSSTIVCLTHSELRHDNTKWADLELTVASLMKVSDVL